MNPIGPGDWVECVDATPRSRATAGDIRELGRLTVGGVYLVVDVLGEDWTGQGGLQLAGLPTGLEPQVGWWCGRFRPIYTPKESLLHDLLQPIDTKVDA